MESMEWIAIVPVIIAKYLIPVLIIPFPFAAGWANFVLDTVDGDVLIPLGLDDGPYQLIDKSADWFTYVGMVIAAREWKIRRTVFVLFVFRTVGQLLFFITGAEFVFFLFPNFLEPLFLIYATIRHFNPDRVADIYTRHRVAIWIFVVLYKLQDEWITHVGNVDRSELITGLFS